MVNYDAYSLDPNYLAGPWIYVSAKNDIVVIKNAEFYQFEQAMMESCLNHLQNIEKQPKKKIRRYTNDEVQNNIRFLKETTLMLFSQFLNHYIKPDYYQFVNSKEMMEQVGLAFFIEKDYVEVTHE